MARTRATRGQPGGKTRGARATRSAAAAAANGEVALKDLVRLAKAGFKQSQAAHELGVPVAAVKIVPWCNALVEAGVWSTEKATAASVKKMYENDGNRWELIAARTGESVVRVKELYGNHGGQPRGRGRSTKSGAPGKTATVRKSGTAKSGTAKAGAGPRRARTRAERAQARSTNPS
jgi:hypothetical protein